MKQTIKCSTIHFFNCKDEDVVKTVDEMYKIAKVAIDLARQLWHDDGALSRHIGEAARLTNALAKKGGRLMKV